MAVSRTPFVQRLIVFGCLIAVLLCVPSGWRRLTFHRTLSEAREALRTGHLPEAVDLLTSLESERPESAELAYLLGVCHRRLNTTSKARGYLARAAELGWPRKDLMLQEAMCDFQAGEKASERFLLDSLKAGCDDPTATEIYECLAKGYLAGVYLREAGLCLDYWLEWQPRATQPHELKAELLHSVGDKAREVEEYRTLVKLDADNCDARLKLGQILLENRASGEALQEFQHCQQLDPENPVIASAVGACQRSLGNFAEAERNLTAALATGELAGEQRAYALVELGQVAVATRKYEKAVDLLKQALVETPADRTAHYLLGLTLTRLGNDDEGNAHLERSTEIDDQNERLSDLMHEIIHAPDDPEPRCQAGDILLAQENYKEAYIWLLSALRCDRSHKATHEALSRYYTATGKPEAAQRHLSWAANGGAGELAKVRTP